MWTNVEWFTKDVDVSTYTVDPPTKSEFLVLVGELPLAYKTKKVVKIGSMVETLRSAYITYFLKKNRR